MGSWIRRLRGALGLALLWALGMGFVGGVLELVDNVAPGAVPWIRNVDMWPQALGFVGFLAGLVFALVLGVAGARRRFDELSLPSFAALGALAGLLLGLRPISRGAPIELLLFTTIGSALAAAASFALARRAEDRALLADGARVTDAGLTAGEAAQLLGPGATAVGGSAEHGGVRRERIPVDRPTTR